MNFVLWLFKMIKLIPDPTFEALVKLTVPGLADPVIVPMTFRHMSIEDADKWFKLYEKKISFEGLSKIIVSWKGVMDEEGKDVPYSKKVLEIFLQNSRAAPTEIVIAWIRELNESRIKN